MGVIYPALLTYRQVPVHTTGKSGLGAASPGTDSFGPGFLFLPQLPNCVLLSDPSS